MKTTTQTLLARNVKINAECVAKTARETADNRRRLAEATRTGRQHLGATAQRHHLLGLEAR